MAAVVPVEVVRLASPVAGISENVTATPATPVLLASFTWKVTSALVFPPVPCSAITVVPEVGGTNTMELGIPGGVLLFPPLLLELLLPVPLLAPSLKPLPQAARAANSTAPRNQLMM